MSNRYPLLAAFRNDIAAARAAAKTKGPFLCWGTFATVPSKDPWAAVDDRVCELAHQCLWPTTWFSMPDGQTVPGHEVLCLAAGLWAWDIEWQQHKDAPLPVAMRPVFTALVGRLPAEKRPEGTDLYKVGLAFIFRSLQAAGLLRSEPIATGKLHWFEGNAFDATLAAVDLAVASNGVQLPPAAPGAPARKPGVNARMLEAIQTNHEAMGWNSRQWAEHLKCGKPAIVATRTWQDLSMARDHKRAERALDRRQR